MERTHVFLASLSINKEKQSHVAEGIKALLTYIEEKLGWENSEEFIDLL